jgi:prephenate dehydrogenase
VSITIPPGQRTAGVVGLGLIGGSVALALHDAGWTVHGHDTDPERTAAAIEQGVVVSPDIPADAALIVVATPVDAVPALAEELLAATSAVVMDTGSVKGPISAAVTHARFVPSHPMAGSEQTGLAGARAELFRGAVWPITPSDDTSDDAFALVHEVVASFGADPVTLRPDDHDRIVAAVSHVPHLTAAALMNVADRRSDEHMAMLRLAAGGFRDMTRIAAGSPDIWPPICIQNRDAITDALDEVIARLGELRGAVADGDVALLQSELAQARQARVNLPSAVPLPPNLAEVRVRVKDQRGELAAITGLAAELDVNIYDLEIAHSAEGPTGVIVLLVNADASDVLRGGLLARGYRPSVRPLS